MIEVGDHNIEISIPIKIEKGRRARTANHRALPDLVGEVSSSRGRFYFPGLRNLLKRAVSPIPEDLIGPIVIRVAHARGDEDILPAIVVQISRHYRPGPKCFQ